MPEVTKKEIFDYWNKYPLGSLEIHIEPGSKEYFSNFEQIKKESSNMARHLFKFSRSRGKRVLDVGCGPGWIALQYAKEGADITAIDLTPASIKMVKKWFELKGLRGHLLVADAESLCFMDSSFDFVSCDGVLHHTPNTEGAIREVWRVLKPACQAMVSLYYRNWYLSRWCFPLTKLLMRLLRINTPHGINSKNIWCINYKELARIYDGKDNPLGKIYSHLECDSMFTQAGFKIIKRETHFFPARFVPILNKFPLWFRKFFDRTCGTMIFCLLEK